MFLSLSLSFPRKRLFRFVFIGVLCGIALLQLGCNRLRQRHTSPLEDSKAGVSELEDKENPAKRAHLSATSSPGAPLKSETGTLQRKPPAAPESPEATGAPLPPPLVGGPRLSSPPPPTASERSRTPQPILVRVSGAETASSAETNALVQATDADADSSRPGRKEIRTALFSGSEDKGAPSGPTRSGKETDKENGNSAPNGPMQLNTFPYHYGNARKFMGIGEWERALGEFRKALDLSPENLECRLAYGECLEKANSPALALAEYQAAASQHPHEPRPCLKIGNLYLTRGEDGDLEKARESYWKALEIRPNYLFAVFNLGLLEKAEKRREEAIAFFEEVLLLDGDYAPAHLHLGLLFQTRKEDTPEAIRHFNRYVELGGEHAEAVRSLLKNLKQEPRVGTQASAE